MAKSKIVKTLFKNLVLPRPETGLEPVDELKKSLEQYFSGRIFPVSSGRSALYLILKAAGIGTGNEVIIQAYTCNAVPNPILWLGAKPVYADIDPETLNVDPVEVEKKITDKTKAIILQHTFGRPGPIEEILQIAKKKGLLVVEDCAHALGAKYKGRKLGTFADAAILSFGREKVISSLAGGAILVKNQKLITVLIKNVAQLPTISFKRMGHEFINFFAWRLLLRRIYFEERGLRFIRALNKHDFFNVVTSEKEKVGERPPWYPGSLPNVLAQIALEEFADLEKYNQHREKIARVYFEKIKNPKFKLLSPHEGIYLRVVALHKDAANILAEARKKRFWFGNWYNAPVYPKGVDEKRLGYERGTCPRAEKAAQETINLPNFLGMSLEQVNEVSEFINNYR